MGVGDWFNNARNPDPFGSLSSGLEYGIGLSDRLQQRREERAIKEKDAKFQEALLSNIETGLDGAIRLRSNAPPAGIDPMRWADANQKIQGYQKSNMDFATQKKSSMLDTFGTAAGSILKDPKLWEPTILKLKQDGYPVENLGLIGQDGRVIPYDQKSVMEFYRQTPQYKRDLDFQKDSAGIDKTKADIKNTNADTNLKWAQAANVGTAKDLKAQEKLEKKMVLMNEIEDRRVNIKAAVGTLKEMIDKDGTYEAFGPHNQNIDRLVEQIATDMAKLQDPSSVARPSEVESIKKNLIQSGFQNRNSSAIDLLASFEGEVDRRADSAYDIRGLQKPQQQEQDYLGLNKAVKDLKVGAVDGGFKFKGGDPNKQENWEPVR